MDSTPLVAGLLDYAASLEKHCAELQTGYEEMKSRALACSRVYEGGDAEEFWSMWHKTDQFFLDYLLDVGKLIPMLNERIENLRQFDRGSSRAG
jgi:hypothetical protein